MAPLYQLLTIWLAEEDSNDSDVQVSVLNVQRTKEDLLLDNELQTLAKKYPNRLQVTNLLTQEAGRGSIELIQEVLPDPRLGDRVMLFVCGTDGFVDHWAGKIGRAPPPPGKTKGPKIQGPLLGLLKEAGYDASQVFKY